ncbi:hypothetical protein IAD21_02575 [Abditibacteriota bacterium]|nr:hypothetical protein IAD21_02575 [Abditibacteriota bacterium]
MTLFLILMRKRVPHKGALHLLIETTMVAFEHQHVIALVVNALGTPTIARPRNMRS